MNPFVDLSTAQLTALQAAFEYGSLKYGASSESLRQLGLSLVQSANVYSYLRDRNLSAFAAAAIVETLLASRSVAPNLALAQTIVVTGPAVFGNEVLKTASRFIDVVRHAKRELMLATFALYQGDQIFEPIHDAMVQNEGLDVTLVLNIPRRYGDTTLSQEIVESFRRELFSKNWPWERRPRVFYSPCSLHLKASDRSSMHGKFVIADEERCFITSANFTEAAQKRNIEVGVELFGSSEPRLLSKYFKQLIAAGNLVEI